MFESVPLHVSVLMQPFAANKIFFSVSCIKCFDELFSRKSHLLHLVCCMNVLTMSFAASRLFHECFDWVIYCILSVAWMFWPSHLLCLLHGCFDWVIYCISSVAWMFWLSHLLHLVCCMNVLTESFAASCLLHEFFDQVNCCILSVAWKFLQSHLLHLVCCKNVLTKSFAASCLLHECFD